MRRFINYKLLSNEDKQQLKQLLEQQKKALKLHCEPPTKGLTI
jgi:hypothetical protein